MTSTCPPLSFPHNLNLKNESLTPLLRCRTYTRSRSTAHGSRPSRAPNASSSPRLSKRDWCTGAYPAANDSNRAWCCVRARPRRADAAISDKEVGVGLAANAGPWHGCRDSSGTCRCCPSLRALGPEEALCLAQSCVAHRARFVGGGRACRHCRVCGGR
jgi:hypothetical protein